MRPRKSQLAETNPKISSGPERILKKSFSSALKKIGKPFYLYKKGKPKKDQGSLSFHLFLSIVHLTDVYGTVKIRSFDIKVRTLRYVRTFF